MARRPLITSWDELNRLIEEDVIYYQDAPNMPVDGVEWVTRDVQTDYFWDDSFRNQVTNDEVRAAVAETFERLKDRPRRS